MAEVAVTDKVVERGDIIAEDSKQDEDCKQVDSIVGTDNAGEHEESVSKDEDKRDSVPIPRDTSQPASSVAINDVSPDKQNTLEAVTSKKSESTSAEVQEKTRQSAGNKESGIIYFHAWMIMVMGSPCKIK